MFDNQAHVAHAAWTVEDLEPSAVAARVDAAPVGPDPLDDQLDVPLSADEALTWVEMTPVDADTTAVLFALDPVELDDAGRLRLAAQWQRVEAAAAGRKLTTVVAFAGTAPDPLDPMAGSGVPDFTDCAVATGLSMSQPAAARMIRIARALATKLRRTREALTAGRLGYLSALKIAEAANSAELTGEQCARLEKLVLPKAESLTPGQVDYLVRKTVARIDPERLTDEQQDANRDAFLDVTVDDATTVGADRNRGDGCGRVFGRGPHLDAAILSTAIEAWARAAKASGDKRTFDQLRWAAPVSWAKDYLTGNRSRTGPDAGRSPTAHGSPVVINIAVDLSTFLGLTCHPMEILGTGALIPAAALGDLLPDAGLRRLITDPMTGYLLDASPDIYRPGASLARFIELRDVTSTGPGSTVPAQRAEIDHTEPFDCGGRTVRDNLGSPNKRWHRAKTIGGWTVTQNPDRTWTWTSPHGHTTTTEPHDYRLGP